MIVNAIKTKTEIENNTCEHHKKNPHDRNYPGCTCSTAFVSRSVDLDELRNLVGERVRITQYDHPYKGKIGTVKRLAPTEIGLNAQIELDDHPDKVCGIWFADEVEVLHSK